MGWVTRLTVTGDVEVSEDERPLQWADLDEALKELIEHFIMCGLSYVSHLKMTHSVGAGAVDTIFTRNCVTTVWCWLQVP